MGVDRWTDEVRQEAPWIMFADDAAFCGEHRWKQEQDGVYVYAREY